MEVLLIILTVWVISGVFGTLLGVMQTKRLRSKEDAVKSVTSIPAKSQVANFDEIRAEAAKDLQMRIAELKSRSHEAKLAEIMARPTEDSNSRMMALEQANAPLAIEAPTVFRPLPLAWSPIKETDPVSGIVPVINALGAAVFGSSTQKAQVEWMNSSERKDLVDGRRHGELMMRDAQYKTL